MAIDPADVANVVQQASTTAAGIERENQERSAAEPGSGQTSGFDVWSHTVAGLGDKLGEDPAATDRALAEGLGGDYASASGGEVSDALEKQASDAWSEFQLATGMREPSEGEAAPEGAMGAVGATFELLTSLEQMISAPLAMIPFPAFPAIRVTDMDVGLPHGHTHPPNVPPTPPAPFPSTGPIIPIPFLSGATQTLVNGMPAARCGDMGLGVWCGGYFPMYEVFLGSSSVWIEGARAGRLLVDVTHHCMFSSPKPSDPPLGPMVGMTIMGSPNVLIGGVPMPSLLDMAMGAAIKGLFKGLGKIVKKLKAAKAGKAGRAAASDAHYLAEVKWVDRGMQGRATPPRQPPDVRWNRLVRKNGGDAIAAAQEEARALWRVEEMIASGKLEIDGDPAFQRMVKDDLTMMATTRTGRETLDRIDGASHAVTIKPLSDAPNPSAGAGARADDWMKADYSPNAEGSPSTVFYDPTTQSSVHTPTDVTLTHELGHSANHVNGTTRSYEASTGPQADYFPHKEEQNVIENVDNPYRREFGLPERIGHGHLPTENPVDMVDVT